MDSVDTASLVAGRGIVGNADQGRARQVTAIERERWEDLMKQLRSNADPSTRRANLLISGLSLAQSRGQILSIGGRRVLIRGETRPCEQMEEAVPGLKAAMAKDWSGGVFGEVLDNGEIRVGDPVDWLEPA